MKVSVVIPVYNVKPYLERCLRSVLRQTHKDLEIIMVDDGSTDGSGELAESLKSLSPCIQVVHQENQGLSGARNTGLRHASGDYVVFLDSDDEWLLPDGLEKLLKNATEDLILFKPVDIWEDGRREVAKDYDVDALSALPDAQAVFKHLVYTSQYRMSAWALLVRRELLIQHDLFFLLGYISEDVPWSLRLWQVARTVRANDLRFYGYYHRKGSITGGSTPSLRAFHCYDKIFSYWKEQCDNGCVNADVIRVYLADLWVNMGYSYHRRSKSDRKVALDILKRHKGLLKYAYTPKAKRAKRWCRFLGVKGTLVALGWYWRLRTVVKNHVV